MSRFLFLIAGLGLACRGALVVGTVAVVCLLVLACGGGGPEGAPEADGIDEIDFVDEPTPTPLLAQQVDVIGVFLENTALLLPDMEYLDTQGFYLERLQLVARDITGHIEEGRLGEVGLEWVVGVHRTVLEWDELQALLAEQDVDLAQREKYGVIYVGMIEAYYRIAFASDRLLGAAVILGPTGRAASDMSLEEERRYRVLLNQATYFAEIADQKVTEIRTSVDSESFALGH